MRLNYTPTLIFCNLHFGDVDALITETDTSISYVYRF